MKSAKVIFFLLLGLTCRLTYGQSQQGREYRNFPIVLSMQFHSLSMPFKDIKSNFKNVGFGIGTEVSLNGERNWVQQFDVVWVKNKGIGNGLLFTSQAAWRPMISNGFFTEIKFGMGYMLSKHPSSPWEQKGSQWVKSDQQRKGMLALPIGIGTGYYNYASDLFISPFAGYQMLLLSKYNKTLPIVPQTLIQTGLRIYPSYSPSHKN
ncbi:hypothetical protein [Cecembia rubra]|uniref:hypothetical protein n=1 Tax=Cecembia rubra TaxID=1485585 RepID=UPI002715481A|nr:hypothetical protein [Cecembia rubra]